MKLPFKFVGLFPLGKLYIWYSLNFYPLREKYLGNAAGMKASHTKIKSVGLLTIDESIISLVITRLLRVFGDDVVPTSIECTLILDDERIRM